MAKLEKPDVGYAWVVAIVAGIINMLLSGLSRVAGILYVAVLNSYYCTREEAMLPFAIRNGMRLCTGPLVGIVGQKYGVTAVTFFGGVLAAAGASLSCLAPDITWLSILWGGLHGIGFSFANTLFHVVVNQYFQNYRATGSGIALSGACIGSMLFPSIIEIILETYGLAGGFLILGGIVMHVLPSALLMKSPPWVTDPEKYAKQWALQKSSQQIKSEKLQPELGAQILDGVISAKHIRRHSSLNYNPIDELVYVNGNQFGNDINVFPPLKGNESWETKEDLRIVCVSYRVSKTLTMKRNPLQQISPAMEEANIFPNGKFHNISEKVSEENGNSKPPLDNHNKPAKPETNETERSFLRSIKTIGMLCTNPVYIHICICMCTYVIISIPITTVIVDYSKDKGISEMYGKYFINALAIGDLAGRLCFGWVTDRGFMTIPYFLTAMMVLQGIFIGLFPITDSLYPFMIVVVLYGIISGTTIVLLPVTVLKYVDINKQTLAMSCVGFLAGLASFSISPLIGHFRDNVGSYDGMFYLTGGISIVSGGMWLLEPLVVKFYFGEDYQEKINNKNYFKNMEKNAKETKPS